jgi:multidrug transporter EmrE-like cation transporter
VNEILYAWTFMGAVVLFSSVGDVFLAKGMSRIGDLGELREKSGIGGVVRAVFRSGYFLLGVFGMALAYFSMLAALSWADLSLAAPATASLTFVLTAILAKIFLKENVDRRRWIAVVLVCVGVVLLAH